VLRQAGKSRGAEEGERGLTLPGVRFSGKRKFLSRKFLLEVGIIHHPTTAIPRVRNAHACMRSMVSDLYGGNCPKNMT
jgi:hypothetical protein